MAGSLSIGSLFGKIELEDRFSMPLAAVAKKLDDVETKLSHVGGALTKSGGTLTAAFTLPLVGAAAASLKFSSDFEAAMTRLSSLAGVSADQVANVKKRILELAPATGIGPQALVEAMTKISSTVSNSATALDILDRAAKGSAAGMGAAVDVAGALTAVINSYGEKNISAAQAADILTQAVKDGGAEAKELAPTLANVVPFAAQLGIKFEEVAANIATVTKLGVPAAEAVTQLGAVMSGLVKESKEGAEVLGQLGLTYAKVRQEVKDKGLGATIADLSDKFGGNTTALTMLFGRMEAVRNIMAVSGAQAKTYAEEIKAMNAASKDGVALQQAFDAMSGKQAQTWAQLSAQVQVIAIKLGDALAPSLAKVIVAAQPVIDWALKLVEKFAALNPSTQSLILGVAALAAAAGPLIAALGLVVSGVGSLLPLLTGGAGLVAMLGAAGPITLGLGAAFVFTLERTTSIREEFEKTSSASKILGDSIVDLTVANKVYDAYVAGKSGKLPEMPTGKFSDPKLASQTALAWMKGKQDAEAMRAEMAAVSAQAAKAGAAMAGASVHVDGFGESQKKAGEKTAGATKPLVLLTDAQKEYAKHLAEVNAKIADALRDVGELSEANQRDIKFYTALGLGVEDVATKLYLSATAVQRYVDAQKEAKKQAQEWLELNRKLVDENLIGIRQIEEKYRASQLAKLDAGLQNWTTQKDMELEAQHLSEQRTMTRYEFEATQIENWASNEKSHLDKSVAGWETAAAAIERVANGKFQALAASESVASMKMAADAVKVGATWLKVIDDIPKLITASLTGGGGFGGAMKAISSELGSSLLGPDGMFGGKGPLGGVFTKLAGPLVDGVGKIFGKTVGNSLAMALPGIGGAIGALAGPLLEKIAGLFGPNAGHKAAEDWAKSTFGGFDQLRAKLNELGAEGEQLWIKLTQGARTSGAAKEAIDAITAAFARQKTATEAAAQAAEDASKRHAAAIDAIRAKYDEQLSAIASEYQSLSESVGKEAVEAEMGRQEILDRARMTELESARLSLEAKRDAEVKAAADSIATTGEVSDAIVDIGDKLKDNRDAWRTWADSVVADAERAYHAATAVAVGHSPGGVRQITTELGIAGDASQQFVGLFAASMDRAYDGLPDLGKGIGIESGFIPGGPLGPGMPTTGTGPRTVLPFQPLGGAAPGTGSAVGAFVQLANGQWVPRNHPLAVAANSGAGRAFNPGPLGPGMPTFSPSWAPGPDMGRGIGTTDGQAYVPGEMNDSQTVIVQLDGDVLTRATVRRLRKTVVNAGIAA